MPGAQLIDENLVLVGVGAKRREDALAALAQLLISQGYVAEEYHAAILDREGEFPTGLPTASVGVAIPHADNQYVKKSGIAAAVLKEPVKFHVMGDPESLVEVKLVFMLSVKDPKEQVLVLRELVGVFQDEDLLGQLAKTKTRKDFASIVNAAVAKRAK